MANLIDANFDLNITSAKHCRCVGLVNQDGLSIWIQKLELVITNMLYIPPARDIPDGA